MLIERYDKNPILTPNKRHSWEAYAVFNGCPIQKGNKIYLLYRAVSHLHYHSSVKSILRISDIGIAESKDGINFSNRKRFIVPEHEWERFGCEDPRITKFENKYFIFYTALSQYPFAADGIKIGLAISRDLEKIDEKHLVTHFNAKAMALFPEKIEGRMWAALTVHTDKPPAKICLASFNQENELWSEEYWNKWYQDFEQYALPLQRKPEDHIEVGAPPLKTPDGWLLIYSYIQNYFIPSKKIFGIEAVLLDLKDPFKIIAKTKHPLMIPEEYYERIGLVPDIVFPSGALLAKDLIYLYYGAADTTCSLAFISLSGLKNLLLNPPGSKIKFSRPPENPIITPIIKNSWEAKATFNPGAIYLQGKIHILYRAQSNDNTSVFGYATSGDGVHLNYRSEEPVYVPRADFEKKLTPDANSGCEDPRLTKIGNKIYMFYTAFDGKNPPRVAMTWIWVEDFLKQKWNWSWPVLISPPNFDDKDACIFPEKIGSKYVIVHRSGNDADLSFHDNLDFNGSEWVEENKWFAPRPGMWDSKKIGIGPPPLKTSGGWLIIYHGVSEEGIYRVGAILTDLKDLTNITSRTIEPIFEPETPYEKNGQLANVVFPCGAVQLKDKIFMYYGGADKVVGVAIIDIKDLLKSLEVCKY